LVNQILTRKLAERDLLIRQEMDQTGCCCSASYRKTNSKREKTTHTNRGKQWKNPFTGDVTETYRYLRFFK